jgi:hypothetical protein
MSEQVTLQSKTGRSATTNPLDERIDPYQSIGWKLRSGTGMVDIPTSAARSAVGNATKKITAGATGSHLSAEIGSGGNNQIADP